VTQRGADAIRASVHRRYAFFESRPGSYDPRRGTPEVPADAAAVEGVTFDASSVLVKVL